MTLRPTGRFPFLVNPPAGRPVLISILVNLQVRTASAGRANWSRIRFLPTGRPKTDQLVVISVLPLDLILPGGASPSCSPPKYQADRSRLGARPSKREKFFLARPRAAPAAVWGPAGFGRRGVLAGRPGEFDQSLPAHPPSTNWSRFWEGKNGWPPVPSSPVLAYHLTPPPTLSLLGFLSFL